MGVLFVSGFDVFSFAFLVFFFSGVLSFFPRFSLVFFAQFLPLR